MTGRQPPDVNLIDVGIADIKTASGNEQRIREETFEARVARVEREKDLKKNLQAAKMQSLQLLPE